MIETLDIRENLLEVEGEALGKIAKWVAREGAIFIEVGSWKGYSSSFLGQVAKDFGGHLYCVDHWKGSDGIEDHQGVEDCLGIFRSNMEALGLGECVHPLVMSSVEAVRILADDIADLIFIDADHHYKEVREDIGLWMRKVKSGGIMCGHDAEVFYSRVPYSQGIDEWLDEEYIEVKFEGGSIKLHPGVVRALYDCFEDKHAIIKGTSVWVVKVEKE